MATPAAPAIPQIAVFGRIPRVGTGKTRLARGVGPERAAELARAFLLDGLERALRVAPSGAWFYVAPEPDRGTVETLAAARQLVDPGIRIALQDGPHLGARMDAALAALTVSGPAVLVGADVPDLPARILRDAVQRLAGASPVPRLVLGPAADGGFVLIGSDRAPGAMLRDESSWGTGDACARTRERAEGATPPWSVEVLEPWWDVDEPADLTALRERLCAGAGAGDADLPRHTAGALGVPTR